MSMLIKHLDEPRRRALILDVADVPAYSQWSDEQFAELPVETALTIVEGDLSGVSDRTKERVLARIRDIRECISKVQPE